MSEQRIVVLPRVEYVEDEWGQSGWGWWTEGWVDHGRFFQAVCEDALLSMLLPPEDLGPATATRDGYARRYYNKRTGEASVSLSRKPNGGRRATYVWWSMHNTPSPTEEAPNLLAPEPGK